MDNPYEYKLSAFLSEAICTDCKLLVMKKYDCLFGNGKPYDNDGHFLWRDRISDLDIPTTTAVFIMNKNREAVR